VETSELRQSSGGMKQVPRPHFHMQRNDGLQTCLEVLLLPLLLKIDNNQYLWSQLELMECTLVLAWYRLKLHLRHASIYVIRALHVLGFT
jgi:hypothetical protein